MMMMMVIMTMIRMMCVRASTSGELDLPMLLLTRLLMSGKSRGTIIVGLLPLLS